MKKLRTFDLLSFYNKRKLCEFALLSLGYDPKRLPRTADPEYGHSQIDESGDSEAQACDAQINALMDGGMPPLSGALPSSSGATSASLSGGFSLPCSAAPPSAKAVPRTSTSVTRPCPTSAQGEQAPKMRKLQDVFPMMPTPSNSLYRLYPPISQQACRKACEAIDHGMGKGYSLRDWYVWYLTEELTEEVMENLHLAWFPETDVIRLVPELTDFPFDPDNLIVKVATPDMAYNPLYDPPEVPAVPTPPVPANMSDPWADPKSKNYPKNFVVRNDVVCGMHGIKPNEVWNFLVKGLTRLEPVHNNYMQLPALSSDCMTVEQFHTGFCGLKPKEISLDGWQNCPDLPWNA